MNSPLDIVVNNLHNEFYMHKTGYAHFLLIGINIKTETYTDKLEAKHFLERPDKCNKIWHIDRDKIIVIAGILYG